MTPSRGSESRIAVSRRELAEPLSLRGSGITPLDTRAEDNDRILARSVLRARFALALLDRDGRVLNANPGGYDPLASGPGELIGRSLVAAGSPSAAIEGRGRPEPFSVRGGGGVATAPTDTRAEDNDGMLARAVLRARFALALLDRDGRVMNANRAAYDLLASGPGELTGRSLVALVHPDDRGWSEPELELLRSGAVDRVRQQLRLVTLDGGERWIELTVHRAGETGDGAACMVAILERIADRGLRGRELERLAYTDPLTGCANRRRFASELDRHLSLSARYGPRGALLMIDIDGLKQINDTHGHQAGDQAILATAELLRAKLRASDITARIGGDEFAVLLPAAGREQAAAVARTLLAAARTAPHPHGGLSLSIGIADIVATPADAAGLFARADRSMYHAKRSGGNRSAIDQAHHTETKREPARDPAADAGGRHAPAVSLLTDSAAVDREWQ